MEVEIEGEIALEQGQVATAEPEEAALSALLDSPPPGQALDRARPRDGRWEKGQSGNPAGRPPRIHPPAAVAEYVIARKTIPLAKKMRELALAGDRQMLKLWFQHVAPARRGGSEWTGLPLVADRAELRKLREVVTEAAEKGAMSAEQAEALLRVVNTVMGML